MSVNNRNNEFRNLIIGLDKLVEIKNGEKVVGINFDNAATTPLFECVMRDVVEFANYYSSIHRGTGYKSKICSEFYDESREIIMKYFNADPSTHTVIYVKNTTEGINKLSYRILKDKNSVVLSSCMEHHSNDLPWRKKCSLDYIDIDESGRLSLEDLNRKLIKYKGLVKYVTVTGASNVTGYVNDIYEIAKLTHKYDAKLIVDGAQLVPHARVNMRPLDYNENIDYLVFSAHKMYAPFGIGVIIAPKDIFYDGDPEYSGGGTINNVTHKFIDWDDPPAKEEAGSPNILGVKALISSLKQYEKIGIENIEDHERKLALYAIKKLKQIPELKIYCDTSENIKRVGIIPFNIEGMNHFSVAEALSANAGIAVRNGCFCAHPYVQKLLNITDEEVENYRCMKRADRPGMVRISFGLYNNFNEIDLLIKEIKRIIKYGFF
jgi:Selenocysteine lyase